MADIVKKLVSNTGDNIIIPQSSVQNLETTIAGKQNTLTAGTGITIDNNVISATNAGTVTDVKVNNTSVVTGGVANIDLTGKQDTLTAGEGISITNNVISSTSTGDVADVKLDGTSIVDANKVANININADTLVHTSDQSASAAAPGIDADTLDGHDSNYFSVKSESVLSTPQTMSAAAQAQARANLGIIDDVQSITTGVTTLNGAQGNVTVDGANLPVGSGSAATGSIKEALNELSEQKAVQTAVADAWVASTEYAVGDYVMHSGTMYKCKTANNDATFTSSKWTVCNVTNETNDKIDSLSSAVTYLVDDTPLVEKFRTMFETKLWRNGNFVNNSTRFSTTTPLSFPYDVVINNPFYAVVILTWTASTASADTYINAETYTTDNVTIPKNTYFTVTFSKSSNANFDGTEASLINLTLKDYTISEVKSELGSIENRLIAVDGEGYYPVDISQFEFGGFTVYSDRIKYWSTNNRVRTKQNTTVHFGKGDTISLSSYDNASLFVGWKIGSVYYSTGSAITTTFTCPVDGEYVILINSVPDAQQSDVYNLYSLLQFTKGDNLIDRVTALETSRESVMHDYLIQKRSWLLHRNCVCIAHQGNYENGTENHCKAEGYRIAATRGFDYGECDIRFSSDGIPVCCHDDTFTDSSTSEEVVIADHTFAELQTYNFYGGRIASFDEIVSICKKYGIGLYIDQYGDNWADAKYNSVFNVIGKYRFASKCKHMCYSEYAAQKILSWDATAAIVCGQPYNSVNIDTALALANAINSQYNKIEISLYIGLGDTIKNALSSMNPKYSVNVYFCETVEQKTEWSQIVDSILTNTHSLMELNEY